MTLTSENLGKIHSGALHRGALCGAGLTTLDTRLESNSRSNPTLSMANIAREDAAAPAPQKKDRCFGLGKAAGYGTLYNSRFEEPFRKAVLHVVEA